MLGSLYYGGQGVSRNLEYSASLFQQSCTAGFTRGCGQLGESYLFGEGVPRDMIKARQILEKACDAGYAQGCFNVGIIHRQGIETPKNEPLAQARFRQGCDLGYPASVRGAGADSLRRQVDSRAVPRGYWKIDLVPRIRRRFPGGRRSRVRRRTRGPVSFCP